LTLTTVLPKLHIIRRTMLRMGTHIKRNMMTYSLILRGSELVL
jgi:hypothetical protein